MRGSRNPQQHEEVQRVCTCCVAPRRAQDGGLLGPGRAEATHDVARCAALLAAAAAMLVLCSRGQARACNAGVAFSMAAINACA
jgi:hypothetical protein